MISIKHLGAPLLGVTSLIVAGALFIADLTALNFDAASILYMTPLIWAGALHSRHQKILLAAACTALALAGYGWHHGVSLQMEALLPRGMAVAGLWTLAVTALGKGKALDQIERRESRLNSLVEERTQKERYDAKKKYELLKSEIADYKRKLNELSAIAETLEATRREAEEGSRRRTELLTALSRQFTAPLESIMSMASVLNDTRLDSEQLDYLETIRTSSRTLHKFAQDLQDLPGLEAGNITLEEDAFVLQTVLEESMDLVGSGIAEHQIQLTAGIDPSLPTTFYGDATRIRQVLTYLIDVTARISPGSSMHVALDAFETAKDTCRLHGLIRSTRSVLTSDELEAVTTILLEGVPPSSAMATDRDLPLYLSSKICGTMDGKAWIELGPDEALSIHFVVEVGIAAVQQPALAVKPWFKNKHVLVVDDHEDTRNTLSLALKSWGIRSTTLASGPEAIGWLAAGKVCDAILLDFDMPDIDGLTFARQINQHSPDLPVVLLTAFGERIADTRISGSISKPIKHSQLYYRLSALFNERPAADAPEDPLAVEGYYPDEDPERRPSGWLYELTNYIDEA